MTPAAGHAATADRLLRPAAACVLAFGAGYALAAGTSLGRRLDAAVLAQDLDGAGERITSFVVNTLSVPVLAIAAVTLAFACVSMGERRAAAATLLAVGGSAAVCRLLEELLRWSDPLGGEELRALGTGFYPSGHSAAAMAVPLSMAMFAPATVAERFLLPATIGTVGIIVSAVAMESHMPSDVVGGILIASLLTLVSTIALTPRPASAERRLPHPQRLLTRAVCGAGALACAGIVAELARRAGASLGATHPLLVAAASVLTALAAAVVLVALRLRSTAPPRPEAPACER